MTTLRFKMDWRGRIPGQVDKVDGGIADLLVARGIAERVAEPAKPNLVKQITNKLTRSKQLVNK